MPRPLLNYGVAIKSYTRQTDFIWCLFVGIRYSRDSTLSLLIGTVGNIEYDLAFVYDIRLRPFYQTPHPTAILVTSMPSRRQGDSNNSRTQGSVSANVPVSAQAARFGLVLGHVGTDLPRVISEEEAEGASSIAWLSPEYTVLQFSSLPEEYTRTAGALEVSFDFLI